MANYICQYRTNYFRIKDEDKFRELCSHLSTEDFEVTVETKENGKKYVYFGGYGSISYYDAEADEYYPMDKFFEAMVDIVDDDDAMIYIEVGHEKLRYLVAQSVIVTNDSIEYLDLQKITLERAAKNLANEQYETQMIY